MNWSAVVGGGLLAALTVPPAGRLIHVTPWRLWPRVVTALLVGALAGAAIARLPARPVAGAAPGWLIIVGYGTLALLAITAIQVDLAEHRLPDILTYPLAGMSVLVVGALDVLGGDGHLGRALAGGALWSCWMLIGALAVPRGFGLGDVKLAFGLGVWLGWISWAALAAGVLAGQLLITASLVAGRLSDRRHRRATSTPEERDTDVPLGPAMVVGALAALLL